MTSRRWLIVNADDLGLSPGVNRGILEAHRRGIVTSASLLVRGGAARDAAAAVGACPDLSVGLHFDLGEWRYRDGRWEAVYEVVSPQDAAAIADEFERQLSQFWSLLGRPPTHVDSHQHAHLHEPARSVVTAACARLRLALRHTHPEVRYCGQFYGQTTEGLSRPEAVTVTALQQILTALPPGITELCCHPGYCGDFHSQYGAERKVDLDVLCNPQVRDTVRQQQIELCSFLELPRLPAMTAIGGRK